MSGIKKAVRAIYIYIVLTAGIQMFLSAYANSYNRMTDKKISTASLIMGDSRAELQILDRKYIFSLEAVSPESKAYFWAYVVTPAELRAELLAFFAFR